MQGIDAIEIVQENFCKFDVDNQNHGDNRAEIGSNQNFGRNIPPSNYSDSGTGSKSGT